MERLTIISLDSHAQMPPDAWPQYLERRYHEFLPRLREEQGVFAEVMNVFMSRTTTQLDVFDLDGAYRAGGFRGLYDLDIRLAEMDRDGVAGEFVYNGDPRVCGMFFQSSNTEYPLDACQAGVRAYHRWLSDTFGKAKDRLFFIGLVGHAPYRNMTEMLQELDWITDRGFTGVSVPGFTTYPNQPPLYDSYWDPFWARCQERNIALWMHAGYGERQGELGREVTKVHRQIKALGGSTEDMVKKLTSEVFNGELFASTKPRRAMWQLMMSGVFDRFPRLKLVLNEIYADWMPATLQYLDSEFEKHRSGLAAKRRPSEYWHSNGLTCLSFVHKAEVQMRAQIGLETLTFGRDYPHTEGTWPNTRAWLRDAFAGVPAEEMRAILSENAIRYFGLDRAKLAAHAQRIGPTLEQILGPGPSVDPKLIAHFDARGDYLQPAEGDRRLPEIDRMFREDLWRTGASA